jgi:hypothetical protein
MLGDGGEKEADDPSLSDCAFGEAIQRVPELGLDYLAIAECPIDPMELLVGERMSKLIGRLRGSYDCILIDGPPVLGAAETRLLAPLADKALLVIKWESTRPEIAQNAVNQVSVRSRQGRKNSSRLLSVVTQVDLKKHALYRYGDIGEMREKSPSKPALDMLDIQNQSPAMVQQQAAEAEGIQR